MGEIGRMQKIMSLLKFRKNLFLLSVICGTAFSQIVFADTTYSAKSTVINENNQEVIRLDVLPVVKTNYNNQNTSIKNMPVYVAPLIEPAKPDKPTLNFNLNNIKNLKKGAILPDDNISQTITSVAQYFNAPYDKVFSHVIGILDENGFEIISFDTKSGRIFANYKNEKPIYVTVSQYNDENVLIKITPADGIYNIPARVTNSVFNDLNKSLGVIQ